MIILMQFPTSFVNSYRKLLHDPVYLQGVDEDSPPCELEVRPYRGLMLADSDWGRFLKENGIKEVQDPKLELEISLVAHSYFQVRIVV